MWACESTTASISSTGTCKRAVALVRFAPAALEHSAVEQDRGLRGAQDVLGTRDGARGADEFQFYQSPLLW
jgi:hypothetical protein